MRRATDADRPRAIEILSKAYEENPSIAWVVKKDKRWSKRVEGLCEYTFDKIHNIGGVYMSADNNGICMIYPIKDLKYTWKDFRLDLKVAFRVIGIERAWGILKREEYIKKHRPKGDYLYFWMIAVDPDQKGLDPIIEMRNATYQMSEETGKPIYAETSAPRNKIMYERYGFETYYEWKVPNRDVTIWFMRRNPSTEITNIEA